MDLGLTAEKVATATGSTVDRASQFLPYLLDALPRYEISTTARVAAFLAQIGHESGGLHWLSEIWGPTAAQMGYDGRADLGNVQHGDGFKYRGRGLIQITGRANYRVAGAALKQDFEGDPDLVSTLKWAVETACWFWESHGCNEKADNSYGFQAITRVINGGLTGEEERVALYERAMDTLSGTA